LLLKMIIYSWFTLYKWWFPIAVLVYQRVCIDIYIYTIIKWKDISICIGNILTSIDIPICIYIYILVGWIYIYNYTNTDNTYN
jgi:hypothetical protein